MIAITGATGHIGNVLVRQLHGKQNGEHVRVIIPPGETLEPLRGTLAEAAVCDVTDRVSVMKALRGADLVLHLAGIISISKGNGKQMEHVNVEGTRNVLEAARACGARRIVYVSSVHAFVEPPMGQAIDEAAPVDPARAEGDYARTKAEATLLARQAAADGLDVVIVHPTGVIGPYEFRGSHTGEMLRGIMRKRYPMKLGGRYDFVDVRDVAAGILLAAEKGRSGESYILGGSNVSIGEVFEIVSRLCGFDPPRFDAPLLLVKAVAPLLEAWARFTRRTPTLTPYALKTLLSNSDVSTAKAHEQLGYSPRPIAETLADCVHWARNEPVSCY